METILLTRDQLAERWHISPLSLRNLASLGKGPAVTKIGARPLYRLADVEAYELAHRLTLGQPE
ncbi:DNA-binding protein [Nocardioides panacisoli]|uniref:DNA-binding protein n=1 Tax=Nocardioides panacisoli TaxID=627624 RepID=A0ABP7IGC7_9ACTN